MLKKFVKRVVPKFLLHEFRKCKYNSALVKMGAQPKPARTPYEWLGTDYGGHVVEVNSISDSAKIYTIGAGLDISFEEELICRTGCHIHIYDPTPRSLAWLKDRFNSPEKSKPEGAHITIHPFGIWSENKIMRFYMPKNPLDVSHSLMNLQRTDRYIEVQCISLKNAIRVCDKKVGA